MISLQGTGGTEVDKTVSLLQEDAQTLRRDPLEKQPEARMKKDGLQRVLDFLDFLDEKGVHYQTDQVRPDALLVFFTLVGVRVEVDFFVDGMRYRYFKGHEDVEIDQKLLMNLINEHSSGGSALSPR
jgi:hypothetical protein